MTTYVIGDIQGCYKTFLCLLEKISFDFENDRLILLGDLINRGPKSLEVLRFIKTHENSIKVVLGNHDLYGLALFLDSVLNKKTHTLEELFLANDAEELFLWLRNQPVILEQGKDIFVHAGILPALSVSQALDYGNKISSELMGKNAKKFLQEFYAGSFKTWSEELPYEDKIKTCLSSFIFMRMCKDKETLDVSDYTDGLRNAPSFLKPWFRLRSPHEGRVFFGHWASLGPYEEGGFICLDSGCVWGNFLTAYNLSSGEKTFMPSQERV